MRIAVVGAGAMGSVYAGLLGAAGNEVWAVDTWAEHVTAIREHGLRVEGASGDRLVRIDATTRPEEVGAVDLVIIATKAMHVRDAAVSARSLVGPDTVVLPIQNGLGSSEVVAEVLGEDVRGARSGRGVRGVARRAWARAPSRLRAGAPRRTARPGVRPDRACGRRLARRRLQGRDR